MPTQPVASTTDVEVRPVTDADVASLATRDPYPGAAAERQQAAGEDVLFVAAWRDSQPVGWGTLDITDEDLQPLLTHLWVFPDARRQGVGSAITTHLEGVARERGYTEVFMLVDPKKEASAIPMYLDLEYAPSGDHRIGQVTETGERTHQAIYRRALPKSR